MINCFKRFATKTEQRIAVKLINRILKEGYQIDVWDSEEMVAVNLDHVTKVAVCLASTGSDTLCFHKPGACDTTGWVLLIWGNGEDVISDYSANTISDELMEPITEWVNSCQN